MGKAVFQITAVAALSQFGCARMPDSCRQAMELRDAARNAPPEQKSALEAQAAGMEDVCGREHDKVWQNYQQQQQDERRQRP
jgi:hypothetical protein